MPTPTADELQVAAILLNLPSIIKSSPRLLPFWCKTKKRSSPPSNLSRSPVSPMAFPSSIDSEIKPLKVESVEESQQLHKVKKVEARHQVEKAIQSQSLIPVPYYLHPPLILFPCQSNGSTEKCTENVEYPQPLDVAYHYRMWVSAVAKNRAAAALARRSRSLILKAKNCKRVPRGTKR